MSKPLAQSGLASLQCLPHRTATEYTVDAARVPGLFIEVRHTGGMTYYLRFRDSDGKTRYQKIGRTVDISLSDAKKQALKLRAGILLGNYPGADKRDKQQCMTFSEFFEQKYLPFARPRKRSWRDDEKLFNSRLRDRFGPIPLDQITRHAIQHYHGELRGPLSPASCDHVLQLISRCLGLAVSWGIITESPAKGIKKFNVDNSRTDYLSPEQLATLFRVLETTEPRAPSLAIRLLALTGARVGEVLHAKWSDIDVNAAVWTVQAVNSKSTRVRMIPLSEQALFVLDQLSASSTSQYVFTSSRTGERLTTVDKHWQKVRKVANIENYVLHSLRHTYASALIQSGESLYTVQQILGHSDPKLTQRYSHLSSSVLQNAANSVSKYLDKAHENSGADND
jgi:integrase